VTAPSPLTRRFTGIAPDLDELQGRRAGIVSRGVALTIDFGVVLIGYPVIMWSIGIVQGLLNFEPPTYPDLPNGLTVTIYVLWSWGYFALSWWAVGRTIGQALLGLRVVSRGRRRVGPIRAAIRTWVMFATLFVIGPLWLLFSKSRLAIHDLAANSQVVHDIAPKEARVSVGMAARGLDDQPK
jgi:uncharacterized RDD family membrane protein YckC